MKKVLLMILIALSFTACKKDSKETNEPTTWIKGKWKRTARYEMIQTQDGPGSDITYDTLYTSNELNFFNSTNVTSSERGSQQYSYTFDEETPTNDFIDFNGDKWYIHGKTTSNFTLTGQFYINGSGVITNYTDNYIKEQ